jgi:hypothetical protein
VSDRIQVGDSLESAIEKTTNEMKLLQAQKSNSQKYS